MQIKLTNKNPNKIGDILVIENKLNVSITSDLELDEEIAKNITIECSESDYSLIQDILSNIDNSVIRKPSELEKMRSDIDYLAMQMEVEL
ncbi:MAG: hypothetical protein KIC94_18785 [Clostridiales bacterium]|nr:hypothetical protein [Clostridiales bacterium]